MRIEPFIIIAAGLCAFRPHRLEEIADKGSAAGWTVVTADGDPNVRACLEPYGERIRPTFNEVFSKSQ